MKNSFGEGEELSNISDGIRIGISKIKCPHRKKQKDTWRKCIVGKRKVFGEETSWKTEWLGIPAQACRRRGGPDPRSLKKRRSIHHRKVLTKKKEKTRDSQIQTPRTRKSDVEKSIPKTPRKKEKGPPLGIFPTWARS